MSASVNSSTPTAGGVNERNCGEWGETSGLLLAAEILAGASNAHNQQQITNRATDQPIQNIHSGTPLMLLQQAAKLLHQQVT